MSISLLVSIRIVHVYTFTLYTVYKLEKKRKCYNFEFTRFRFVHFDHVRKIYSFYFFRISLNVNQTAIE